MSVWSGIAFERRKRSATLIGSAFRPSMLFRRSSLTCRRIASTSFWRLAAFDFCGETITKKGIKPAVRARDDHEEDERAHDGER